MMRTRGYRRLISAIVAATAVGLISGSALAQEPAAEPIPPAESSPPAQVIPPAAPSLVRITSSFEVKHAGAVLKKVAKLFRAGFIRKDAEQLATDINQLPAEQSRRWGFTVLYKGTSYPLQIRARLDDFGMLDLDFFCAASAAGAVREAVDGYLNSHNL